MQQDSSTSSPGSATAPQPPKGSGGNARAMMFHKYSAKGKPACFDSGRQWTLWLQPARLMPPDPVAGFCEDCEVSYQQRMIKEKRCCNPNYKFNEVQ
jgi:hypothetical protein